MLMPAAVVIVVLLGAIAVDSAIAYLAQRQALNIAFDAANDAAGAGYDRDRVRDDGSIVFEAARVEAIARETVAASAAEVDVVAVSIDDTTAAVTVTVRYRRQRMIGQAFGASADEMQTVSATVTNQMVSP